MRLFAGRVAERCLLLLRLLFLLLGLLLKLGRDKVIIHYVSMYQSLRPTFYLTLHFGLERRVVVDCPLVVVVVVVFEVGAGDSPVVNY